MTSRFVISQVAERDGYRCAHCGTTLGLSVQHRANRGMGGSLARDCWSNVILLCARLNLEIEANAALRVMALRNGWKCRQTDDTRQVPVFVLGEGWFLLDDEGGRRSWNG